MHSNPSTEKKGTLYVVATPIGNLEDITLRALKILKSVDVVAAEDTRHTGKLLSHHGIQARLFACHEHNEEKSARGIVDALSQGQNVALVSDAGTPSVSDPGYRLVAAAAGAGYDVLPIPGPSASVSALSVSGIPTDSFIFIGFAPKKKGKRETLLKELAGECRTLIFYESPNRIIRFLEEIKTVMGDRKACLSREITKIHEEYIRGTVSDIIQRLEAKPSVKGECTLILGGSDGTTEAVPETTLEEEIAARLEEGARPSSLAKELSAKHGLRKKVVYEMIQDFQSGKGMAGA